MIIPFIEISKLLVESFWFCAYVRFGDECQKQPAFEFDCEEGAL